MSSPSKWHRPGSAFGALAAGLLAALAAPAQAQAHVDNPFVGASMYVNPDFTASADATAAATSDAQLASRMRAVGRSPTAVWLDRIEHVPSLATHLDRAVAAGHDLALFVLHDVPGRNCGGLVLDGELPLGPDGLGNYRSLFIDPIAAIAADPKYAGVRIVFIVEPGALAKLVTGFSTPECLAQAQSSRVWVEAVQYAVNTLHPIPNVYLYLDLAHAGWLGWDENAARMVALLDSVSSGFTARKGAVDGFSTNISDFVPLAEPYLTPTTTVNGQPVRSARFYQYNSNLDDASFSADLWTRLTAAGWPTTIGMLADTSRNGWGGEGRPVRASSVTDDLERFVNESRLDRRTTRSAWCNPSGAGIGERPAAAPPGHAAAHHDAFVWVKTPGLSDGSALEDRWCDPTYLTQEGVLTGALPGAPGAGQWFPAQFTELVQNMSPAIALEPVSHTLTVTPNGLGQVTSTPAGIDCGGACSGAFAAGTEVTLTAVATTSSMPFRAWTGACAGTTTPTCVVSMTQAQTVGTSFGELYTLTVAAAGAGAVTSSPGGISCGTSCSATYEPRTAVTLTARASAGSSFAGWGGACQGAQPTCTVWMNASRSVTATFQGGTWYPLTVQVSESGVCNAPPGCVPGAACPAVCYGGNAVTSSPAGISCGNGGACSAAYASGTSVALTAIPYDAQNHFAGWVGACGGSTARTCVVPMTEARSVTARFLGASVSTLHVSTAGLGLGRVTGGSGAVDCGTVCDVQFSTGTTVTLTATAAGGSTFAGWGGACSGTGATCAVPMTQAQSVVASFGGPNPVFTVTRTGTGTGTVTSTPAGIDCGAVCSASIPAMTVTLSATAAAGSVFTGWSGGCTGVSATCVLQAGSLTQTASAVATFASAAPPCTNPIAFSWNTGNFNTTGAACYRTRQRVNGWGCSNFGGRTVRVNDGAATATCGAGPLPLARSSDGYTYFIVSGGQSPWASVYVW